MKIYRNKRAAIHKKEPQMSPAAFAHPCIEIRKHTNPDFYGINNNRWKIKINLPLTCSFPSFNITYCLLSIRSDWHRVPGKVCEWGKKDWGRSCRYLESCIFCFLTIPNFLCIYLYDVPVSYSLLLLLIIGNFDGNHWHR